MRTIHVRASLGAVLTLALSGASLSVACGGDDAGTPTETDAGTGTDSGKTDSGPADSGPPDAGPAKTYAIGGTVAGLKGTGLTLANGTDTVSPVAGATPSTPFVFGTKVPAKTAYAVTVTKQPTSPAQVCTVAGGTGTVVDGDISSVMVNCELAKFSLGGTITGLTGSGLVLTNQTNGVSEAAVLNANGTFAFPTPLNAGSQYAVTVTAQPKGPPQTCVVSDGTGTINADVTTIAVACTTDKFAVGGTITGLDAGKSVVLKNNGADDLTRNANGAFTFATPIASGQAYAVTVGTQPVGQTCSVTAGAGNVGTAAVADVAVTCHRAVNFVGNYAGFIAASGAGHALVTGDDVSEPNAPGGYYFTVAPGVAKVQITLTGAAGSRAGSNGGTGGTGVFEMTPAYLTAKGKPGFWVIVGGAGKASTGGAGGVAGGRAFNGGGAATDWSNSQGTFTYAAGGGGGTDVRLDYNGDLAVPTAGDPTLSFASRFAIVGGGGGGTANGGSLGGAGGGFNAAGTNGVGAGTFGTGGTLLAAGSIGAALGLGGDGLQNGTQGWAAGGGGGYYGGGASSAHYGGGAGSGFLANDPAITQVSTANGVQGGNAATTVNGAFKVKAL